MSAGTENFPDFDAFWDSIVDDMAADLWREIYDNGPWANVSSTTRLAYRNRAEKLLGRLKESYKELDMSQSALSARVVTLRKQSDNRIKRIRLSRPMIEMMMRGQHLAQEQKKRLTDYLGPFT